PGPIMAPVLVLIMAIIYGLSTDYEVFLLSRMVEARAQGASTTEAVRVGTAHTGRIISAAALILIVVTGAFAFSELVMMKYIAYGMIAALVIDATLIRMFLVPATMKLLGDDCWWAPAWMKRIQEKLGLGEPILEDELMPSDIPDLAASYRPTARREVGSESAIPLRTVGGERTPVAGPTGATHAPLAEGRTPLAQSGEPLRTVSSKPSPIWTGPNRDSRPPHSPEGTAAQERTETRSQARRQRHSDGRPTISVSELITRLNRGQVPRS
ncbi:MMPL family transporter, partial [Rhodococcus sp. UNC363MFTsu5.1]|uniref:MMPL family transporter n=1 Tax=Rhodococcus sp. UNC363MFTsu5.1 TaxID=1449069 RepID=UPI00055CA9D2